MSLSDWSFDKRNKMDHPLIRRPRTVQTKVYQKWRHHLHHRAKRYIHPRQMSVAIFADVSLNEWFKQFGRNFISIENYIQDIMGITSTIMRHPSLEQDISIDIVEITVIQNRFR